MAKHSKRYLKLLEKIDKTRYYKPEEAIPLLKSISTTKFTETVECAIKLNVDPRKQDQMVRGTCLLPHGTGKKVKVLVLTPGEGEKEALEAGADYVGFKEYIDKINQGWLDFDVIVTTPEAMKEVSKLGKILGPRGLMPSPKTGTVTKDLGRVVKELKRGRIEFKVDKTGNLHAPVGKVNFSENELLDNFYTFLNEVLNARPPGLKGNYISKISLSTTMSPGVKIDINYAIEEAKRRKT
ncbi:MAG: 50S ribosomal protein L1 [Candidatus Hydrothermales bacterium]